MLGWDVILGSVIEVMDVVVELCVELVLFIFEDEYCNELSEVLWFYESVKVLM